jgi:membrane-associated phospholipid phosphatase
VSTIPEPVGRELRVLVAVQRRLAGRPGALGAARGLSHFGEHSLGWAAAAGVGMALDRSRRGEWGTVAVGAVGAHAVSIALKRVVRRPRPNHPSVAVHVSTPSRLSFPSSHASSTAAAAFLMSGIAGWPLVPLLVPPMLLSRLLLGVHYPTDVVAGALLGVGCAASLRATQDRYGLGGGHR